MSKVCVLLPDHWDSAKGGAEFQAHIFADYMARCSNHEIVYLTKRAPKSCNGYSYRVAKFGSGVEDRYGMFWDAISLYRTLWRLKPEVVVQRVASAHTGIAAFYCRQRGAKLLWHVSSDRDVSNEPELSTWRVPAIFDKALFRYGVRNATAIVTQTQVQAKILEATYGRAATAVVPNFADVPERSWTKSAKFTVLWIANLKRLKQPEVFIKLARDLAEYDMEFKIIGRRDSSNWCRSVLEEISRERNLEYLGELALDEVNAQLERAHLLVNTSLYEGLPNTFIQAWMREVPTVTLNVDPDGMIAEAHLGCCASGYDTLKAAVLRYFGDPQKLSCDGSAARNFAIGKFSMRNAHTLARIVSHLVDGDA